MTTTPPLPAGIHLWMTEPLTCAINDDRRGAVRALGVLLREHPTDVVDAAVAWVDTALAFRGIVDYGPEVGAGLDMVVGDVTDQQRPAIEWCIRMVRARAGDDLEGWCALWEEAVVADQDGGRGGRDRIWALLGVCATSIRRSMATSAALN